MVLAALLFPVARADGEEADAADDDEEFEFEDSPLLSSMWEATSSANNDALDRLLDSSEVAIKLRSADGRGLPWWAWEFKNAYALGSILSLGGDPLAETPDAGGAAASSFCGEDCDKDALMTEAKALIEDIKARKEERAKQALEELEDDDDDDDDLADVPGGDEEDIGDDEF